VRRTPHRRSAPAPRPASSPRRARRHSTLFLICSGLLVAGLVLGLVTLNAIVAQSSFTVDDLSTRVQELQREAQEKRLEYAHLTAPDRIVSAAGTLGLRLPAPGAVQVIHVAGSVPHGAGNPSAGAGPAGDRG
jgi:cell division protein FtsL